MGNTMRNVKEATPVLLNYESSIKYYILSYLLFIDKTIKKTIIELSMFSLQLSVIMLLENYY